MHRETTGSGFSLAGSTALVTGGGSGIGEAICEEFARAGATVLVAEVAVETAEQVAGRLLRARAMVMDVSSLESVGNAAERVERLDIPVNNAGVGLVGTIEQTQPAELDRVMRVNVNSVFYVTQVFLRRLLAVRGSIVNIASIAGVVGVRDRFAYCASKGAVVTMMRQLAVDYPGALRVNCICPRAVDSPFVSGYLAKYHAGHEDEMREQLKARQPVGRLGRPDEVASLARYMCSAEAEFMHDSG